MIVLLVFSPFSFLSGVEGQACFAAGLRVHCELSLCSLIVALTRDAGSLFHLRSPAASSRWLEGAGTVAGAPAQEEYIFRRSVAPLAHPGSQSLRRRCVLVWRICRALAFIGPLILPEFNEGNYILR